MNQESTNNQPADLPDKIMHRIKEERMAPQPRWHYSLKNILFWTLWALSILAGAAAISASLFAILNSGWEYSNLTHQNALSFMVDAVPILWITTFSLLLFVSYLNFRLTKGGYRYPLLMVIGLGMLGSLILGTFFFRCGIGDLLERRLGPHIPLHRPIMMMQKNAWLNPLQGLLAGDVENIEEDASKFTLRAYDGKTWIVYTEFISDFDLEILKNFKEVRVIGRTIPPDNNFRACRIFPWKLQGQASFLPGPERSFPLHLRRLSPSTSTLNEKDLEMKRNTECEGLRPYKFLRQQFDSPANF